MAKIYIKTVGHTRTFDVVNMCLLFWPGSKILDQNKTDADILVLSKVFDDNGIQKAYARIRYNHRYYSATRPVISSAHDDILLAVKQSLYIAGNKATSILPPWGTLTGIRPMSVYEKAVARYGEEAVDSVFERDYFVSSPKRKILNNIYTFRKDVYYDGVNNDASLYVSIPFCPSKCTYCSFVSSAIERVRKLIDPYLELLKNEIAQKIDLLNEFNIDISTVYVGGGTPGTLAAEQIDDLLGFIFSRLKKPLKEFCFEIGRPETVTKEKLEVLKKYPVDRLCINCQTLNDNVLLKIGRKHTAKEFLDAFKLAKTYGFSSINVDYIAGLPEETLESHISSLQQGILLDAENITVHTLSIKRASTWETPGKLYDPASDTVSNMLLTGYELLEKNGYYPYYIYRQKSTLSNGENIGYAKQGSICKYNIYMMEDVHTVVGCGAGASTKIIHNDNGRIDRFVNTKYPQEYLKYPQKLTESLCDIRQCLKGNNE